MSLKTLPLGIIGTVLGVAGGTPDGPPAFDSIINVKASARDVINFSGDLTNAAIEIAQPKHSAPIVWRYDEGKKEARMTVDNRTGRLTYEGGPIQSEGGITALGGISGTDVAARMRSRTPARRSERCS